MQALEHSGVFVEMADLTRLVLITSPADDPAWYPRLTEALAALPYGRAGAAPPPRPRPGARRAAHAHPGGVASRAPHGCRFRAPRAALRERRWACIRRASRCARRAKRFPRRRWTRCSARSGRAPRSLACAPGACASWTRRKQRNGRAQTVDRNRLLGCLRAGNVMHALLIAGPDGSGRAALAREAAAAFLAGVLGPDGLSACPDYRELSAPYGVDDIRTMTEAMAAQSFSHGRRAFVLLDAHLMNANCQNALLKSLEEPPADTLLLLEGHEPGCCPRSAPAAPWCGWAPSRRKRWRRRWRPGVSTRRAPPTRRPGPEAWRALRAPWPRTSTPRSA